MLNELNAARLAVGLEISKKKAVAMGNLRKGRLLLRGEPDDFVDHFTYLGASITCIDGNKELARRIGSGWAAFNRHRTFLTRRTVPMKMKRRVFHDAQSNIRSGDLDSEFRGKEKTEISSIKDERAMVNATLWTESDRMTSERPPERPLSKPREVLSQEEISNIIETLQIDMKFLYKTVYDLENVHEYYLARARGTRSGIEFLAEDIVKNEEKLRLKWREFVAFGATDLDYTLHELGDRVSPYFFNGDAGDMRAVPWSHNFWTRTEIRDSEANFGRNITSESLRNSPLIPEIAVRKERNIFSNSLCTIRSSADKNYGRFVLENYFNFSIKCRQYKQHPLSTYSFSTFPAANFVHSIPIFDILLQHVTITADFSDVQPRKILSAIELMDEELVPHIAEAQIPWKVFRQGESLQKLDVKLKNSPIFPMPINTSLTNIPSSHWWWKPYGGGTDYVLPSFSTFFSKDVEKMLCVMAILHETLNNGDQPLNKLAPFLYGYFDFVQRCRMHSQIYWNVIPEADKKEFMLYLPSLIFALKYVDFMSHSKYSHMFQLKDVTPKHYLKKMRSAIEFLREEFLPVDMSVREEFDRFLKGDEMRSFNEMVNCHPNEDNKWGPADLRSIPESHFWWSKECRIRSQKEYGTSAWDLHEIEEEMSMQDDEGM